MSHSSAKRLRSAGRFLGRGVLAVALIGLFAIPGEAIDLSGSSGKYTLNLDITVSWGARYRVQEVDQALIGLAAGGEAFSVNGDDGNQNFKKGSIVSNTPKATVDFGFSLNTGRRSNIGFFTRASAFYDFALMQNCCERTELTDEALDWAGSRTELLDAYLFWQFPIGQIRVGRQVLNWGESTFIQGGMSVINPVDVSALRVPGSELREAFRPVGMAWASFDISSNVSVEGFYEYEWEPIVIDPPGTYFSTNDFAGPGGTTVFLGFGDFADTGESPFYIQPPVDYPFLGVARSDTQEAKDDGQYGLALRLFVPSWGGTEFGFYYVNYHSRLPTINGYTGTQEGGLAAAAAVPSAALAIYAYFGVPPGVSPEVDAIAASAARGAAVDAFAHTASWFTAYPEDIKLYGFSWNAQLGTSGIAFQGEVTHRQDAPYQVDDVEVLFAALSPIPISTLFADASQITNGTPLEYDQEVVGHRLLDSSQLQFTFTKIWSRILGADQGVLVGEFGFNKVWDMPAKEELRFEAPGTYTSGNPAMSAPGGAHAGKQWEDAKYFADDFSWGYRLAGRLTYNNAIGAWALAPRFAWSHDPHGNTPGPGGSFLAGRMAATIGIQAQYQNAWQIDLSYTSFIGAGRHNLINDRDFIGGFVKFSF
jgi:hypothetical protein